MHTIIMGMVFSGAGSLCPGYSSNKEVPETILARAKYVCYTQYDRACVSRIQVGPKLSYKVLCKKQ